MDISKEKLIDRSKEIYEYGKKSMNIGKKIHDYRQENL
jgi:hypothetical protein